MTVSDKRSIFCSSSSINYILIKMVSINEPLFEDTYDCSEFMMANPDLSMEEIPKRKPAEGGFGKPEDDTDDPIYEVKMVYCPFHSHSHCNRQSFGNASVRSFHGIRHCLCYAMQHGVHSAKHNLKEEQAFNILKDELEKQKQLESGPDIFEFITWTREDRDEYRRDLAEKAEKAKADAQAAPIGSSKRRKTEVKTDSGMSTDNLTAAIGAAVQSAMTPLLQQVADSGSTASSATWSDISRAPATTLARRPPVPTIQADDMIEVPLEKLKLLQNSMQRAEHAISGGLKDVVNMATKLKGERDVIQNALKVISTFTGDEPIFLK